MKQRSWDVRKDASDLVPAGIAGRRGCKRDRAETVGDQAELLNFRQVALEAWSRSECTFSAIGKT